jgi:TldD protein
LKDLAEPCLGAAVAEGAEYADVRVLDGCWESIRSKNGQVKSIESQESTGLGVRVLAGGAWGFASTSLLTAESVQRTAAKAVEIARASATANSEPVRMAPEDNYVAVWKTPYLIDPFRVSLKEKCDLLMKIDEKLRSVEGVTIAEGSMSFTRKKQLFMNTEGSAIDQEILTSGAGYSAVAVGGGDMQRRSYPSSFDGQVENRGYEMVYELPLIENAERIGSEAVQLLSAEQCPKGEMDLILGSSQLGLQIHESCGHPAELDRALGTELNYAGGSFLKPEMLGDFKYGSPIVNLTADSVAPRGAGSFGYDDEGVPGQKWDLVRDGMFVGYLTSRETAHTVGDSRSRGAMRAHSWNRIPLIRMNNVSLEPGEGSLDDLIADTSRGIYMETNRSWSIDQLRYNFQFGTEFGWLIENGKKTKLVKNPTYQGMTPEFWGSCDAICGFEEWVLWGLPNCGKGEPGQTICTAHGASPARFRNVMVGVGYDDQ